MPRERKRKILIVTVPINSDEQADELGNTLTKFLGDANVQGAEVFSPEPDLADFIDQRLDD